MLTRVAALKTMPNQQLKQQWRDLFASLSLILWGTTPVISGLPVPLLPTQKSPAQ
jgi:hypothetical protein